MQENLMDIKETAEYLRMNKMTVYKLAREGKIPAFKVASEWRFRKDLIDGWLMGQLKNIPAGQKIQRQAGKTVLVVDDEKTIQDFFSNILTNYNILIASSGEEALKIVKEKRPDLVLLDIKMPGINGIETLRQIKAFDNSIAVVMLSAYATLETNIEAARLGAYTSMAKPFDYNDIENTIKGALQSSSEAGNNKIAEKKKKRSRRPHKFDKV